MDFDRPRGDITTVLDLVSRDAQDGYFFPNSEKNSFYTVPTVKTHPTTNCIQEFVHKGTADWGGRVTFELGALTAGDMLQGLLLQMKLGHWYSQQTISNLAVRCMVPVNNGYITNNPPPVWTYANSMGTSIIEYAEFEVGDQTLERITGEFIQTHLTLYTTAGTIYGITTDGTGTGSIRDLVGSINAFSLSRPWPTDGGQLFCLLPFFFMRKSLEEAFPLVSCTEGSVRVHIKLRQFSDMVRVAPRVLGSQVFRNGCTDTPVGLGKMTDFINVTTLAVTSAANSATVPPFDDFRILTVTSLCGGKIRSNYLRNPFEYLVQFMQEFRFSEPLKYLVSKVNSNTDTVDISLPLELNHPVKELFWVFRRTGVQINNEWANFSPILESQYVEGAVRQPWLKYATLRINGSIVDQADGDWWRWQMARKHASGITAWNNNVYGYSFARFPEEHQPSGTANMSRAHTVQLNMTVNVPVPVYVPPGFDASCAQGGEVQVFVIHYNWLRFEKGLCQKLYSD